MKVFEASSRFVAAGMYPKEMLPTITAKTWYHQDLEKTFHLVWHDTRFALGLAWCCNHCGSEARTHEEWIIERKEFLLIQISCPECRKRFTHPGALPLLKHPDDVLGMWDFMCLLDAECVE